MRKRVERKGEERRGSREGEKERSRGESKR